MFSVLHRASEAPISRRAANLCFGIAQIIGKLAWSGTHRAYGQALGITAEPAAADTANGGFDLCE
jgi:hypothetical protein